jgi:hypothetical protein
MLSAGFALFTLACGNDPADPDPQTDAGFQGDAGIQADADPDAGSGDVGLCTMEPSNAPPRPTWSEIEDGSGLPDYQNVMNNLNVLDSLRLFASMLSKAVGGIEALQNAADTDATGHCICNCTGGQYGGIDWGAMGEDPGGLAQWAIDQGAMFAQQCYINDYTREACVQKCDAVGSPNFSAGQGIQTDKNFIWVPNDVFKNPDLSPKYALKLIGFLDEVSGFLSSGGTCTIDDDCDGSGATCDGGTCKSGLRAVLDALGSAGADLTQAVQDVITALEQIEEVINRFTEGYHLGGYSAQRPDLHMCVGYGGHGAYAQLGNLGGDKVSIGARYTSHQLSHEHRAQFRTGGFGVQAFGKSLSLLPSAEANTQIHGFKLWDASKPFGIPMQQVGSIPTSEIEKYDVFQLIEDPSQLEELTNGDGTIDLPGDLLVDNYYTANYTSAADGNSYTWPRSEATPPKPWLPWTGWEGEDQSTAVFSAGLNLPLAIEPLELDLPAIDVFPPFATLQPYFRLGAGVEWIHEDFRLLSRIQEKVNENLPANEQLDEEDFERDMHAMQAPDVSEDLGTTAYVQPELGATLSAGLNLSSFLQLGIGVSIGVGARVEPGGWGGLVDLNYALVQALMNSNPPPEADCNAVWEPSSTQTCSNASFEESTESYLCLDGGTSSCCIAIGPRNKVCVEDWTGIDEAFCTELDAIQQAGDDKEDQLLAWLDELGDYVDAAAVQVLLNTVEEQSGDLDVDGTWNANQTCEDSDCGANVGQAALEHQTTCERHGYCVDGNDTVLAHDVTEDECEAIGQGGEDVTGRCCFNFGPDQFQSIKCGVPIDDCNLDDAVFVPNGLCTERLDASNCTNPDDQRIETADNERNWVKYQCVTQVEPELTGWEGPGCHPLNEGYPSACGCSSDADCAGNETCNDDGICEDGGYACTCDPDGAASCGPGRSCEDGACFKECSSDGECGSGLVCESGLCRSEYGIPTAEEIVWGMQNGDAPLHAVSTYALSDMLFWAYLSFNIDLGLTIDFFFGSQEFTLFDWGKVWDLASQYKSWYQPGLEARYQSECVDPNAQVVTNRQPEAVTQASGLNLNTYGAFSGHVDRYPDPFPQSSLDPDDDGNACHPTGDANSCQWDDLVGWCKPKVQEPSSVVDPDAPDPSDLGDSFTDTVEWGEEIGLELWESKQVCIDGQLWHEWAQNQSGTFDTNTQCRYENPDTGQTQVFACGDIMDVLLEEWGCLSTSRPPYGPHLASQFGSAITTNNGQTFDIDAMAIDPSQPLTIDNLEPQIRFNPGGIPFAGQNWMADVESCFDVRHAHESRCECTADSDCHENLDETCNGNGFCERDSGQLSTCPVVTFAQEPEVTPCCGDGQIQGNEACDDGNTVGGDGCSSYCTREEGDSDPTGACCDGETCQSGVTAAKCNATESGVFYPNQSCDEIECGTSDATGACCLPGGNCADNSLKSKCEANSGTFSSGQTCSQVICQSDEDRGACCVDGTCTGVTTRKECSAQGGTFSNGRKCSDVDCGGSADLGACCIGGECAGVTTRRACAANKGTFSSGRKCSDITCGGSTDRGACCVDGRCTGVTTRTKCNSNGGRFSNGRKCSDVTCGG